MTTTLVLGGARSGKSALAQTAAESHAREHGGRLAMIVTAQPFDDEMAARIARHREDRGGLWRTVEATHDLPAALENLTADDVVVVDCLTLWLSNLMLAEQDMETAADALVAAVGKAPCPLWLVSNEVGLGIVPENALARRFRDGAGRLHQRLAKAVERVIFVAAGLPLTLKG
ncbi:bifunctional adenosylcobinamide kinase/adenosylcobinamide-phosphate guanylyltransferase [Caulobacter segnis]|uniref:bifunctional adenosylcobinamide kinase/adenosylcobinamide-phosphate guanylyltransferase n=1 Tax=Caulobacter segnis TaxID=88688 RepID=UPI002410202F|nr:bifunctional adenosylcobinamide kinase/adenosylcobinamide-phosphate guanylyltransferase [Caulobacter segnis]MDG2521841.1 bifunctional adenosylcobinamide kinase/adenosylcobinamide-phosphate guanylyltransferase [Caulobacter segnis]